MGIRIFLLLLHEPSSDLRLYYNRLRESYLEIARRAGDLEEELIFDGFFSGNKIKLFFKEEISSF